MNNYINYTLYFSVKVTILYIILNNVYFMLKFNEITNTFCKIIELQMANSSCTLSFLNFIFIYTKFFFNGREEVLINMYFIAPVYFH